MILASSAEEVGESFAHMAGVPDAEHGTLVAGAFLLVLGRYIACLDLHIDCRRDGRRYTVREGKVNLLTKHIAFIEEIQRTLAFRWRQCLQATAVLFCSTGVGERSTRHSPSCPGSFPGS